jgi:hypothetical protein
VKTRAGTAAAYALVVILSIELALWECFLVEARPFGTALPLAAALAVVANPVLSVAGTRVLRRRLGGVVPGVIWLVIALTLGSNGKGGDRVVTGDGRGLAFLLLGTVSAAVVAGATGSRRPVGATPGAPDSR